MKNSIENNHIISIPFEGILGSEFPFHFNLILNATNEYIKKKFEKSNGFPENKALIVDTENFDFYVSARDSDFELFTNDLVIDQIITKFIGSTLIQIVESDKIKSADKIFIISSTSLYIKHSIKEELSKLRYEE